MKFRLAYLALHPISYNLYFLMAISHNLTKDHILSALNEIDPSTIPPHHTSHRYFLLHEGKEYPPKYVVAMARKLATGEEPDPKSRTSHTTSLKVIVAAGNSDSVPTSYSGAGSTTQAS